MNKNVYACVSIDIDKWPLFLNLVQEARCACEIVYVYDVLCV